MDSLIVAELIKTVIVLRLEKLSGVNVDNNYQKIHLNTTYVSTFLSSSVNKYT